MNLNELLTLAPRCSNVAKERDLSAAIGKVDAKGVWQDCPFAQRFTCVALKYRTGDGQCNNLLQSRQGAMGEPLRRLLPPAYADCTSIQYFPSLYPSLFLPLDILDVN